MSNFNWNYPTNIWGGENRIKDLNKACTQLNMKNPLIVTDSGLAKSKMLLETIARLNAEGIKNDIFSNIIGFSNFQVFLLILTFLEKILLIRLKSLSNFDIKTFSKNSSLCTSPLMI